jgi:chromosome segregation ATPase
MQQKVVIQRAIHHQQSRTRPTKVKITTVCSHEYKMDLINLLIQLANKERTISSLSNLKRKMEEIDRERAAFKIEQSKLEEEVSTVTCSLTKLMEDILGIHHDMTQMSTSLRSKIAKIKNLLLNMSAKKEGAHNIITKTQK